MVIGGGPAGSTTSTLLAQQQCRVELFERERCPRFHIGESLIPETYWVLKRLNILPKMHQSHFVKKYYDGFSFGNFVRKHPTLKGSATALAMNRRRTRRKEPAGRREEVQPGSW